MTKEESNTLDRNEINNIQYDSSLSKTTNSPGFLVSFLVDARGGAMFGRRHSGVDIIIPPGKVCMPTRLTCRMVKRDKIGMLPPLSEEEAFVSRFVQVGPTHTSFIGPVLIEIPHFGSLQCLDREVVVMRSDDGRAWTRHNSLEPSDNFLQFVNEATKDCPQNDKKLVSKIYTNILPKFFVVVSRFKQTSSAVDMNGAMIQVCTASINLPPGAVTKETRITLKVIPVEKDTISSALQRPDNHNHDSHTQALESSHIVSVEPRRRKFHQAVAVNVSVSKAMQDKMKGQNRGGKPSVLLLYNLSNTNSPPVWEDAAELVPYTIYKDIVTFKTNVSARYWLLEKHPSLDTLQMARQVYQEAISVPFYACFHVLVKPLGEQKWQMRVLCVDDMLVSQSMEKHDNFLHIASSQYVQVLNTMSYHVTLTGNLKASVASSGQLYLAYRPFRVNRLAFVATVIDASGPVQCRLDVGRGTSQESMCSFDFTLPSSTSGAGRVENGAEKADDGGMRNGGVVENGGVGSWKAVHDEINVKFDQSSLNNSNDVRLVDVAEMLRGDWVGLSEHLGVGKDEVLKLQTDYGNSNEQALLMLQLWMGGSSGAGLYSLEAGLKKIGREDIVEKCLAPPTRAVNQDLPMHPIDSSYHESLHGEAGGGDDGVKEMQESMQEAQIDNKTAQEEDDTCDKEEDEDYTDEEVEEEVVWVGEDGVEVREMVLTKVRTLKKSPDHDAHAVMITQVPVRVESNVDV